MVLNRAYPKLMEGKADLCGFSRQKVGEHFYKSDNAINTCINTCINTYLLTALTYLQKGTKR